MLTHKTSVSTRIHTHMNISHECSIQYICMYVHAYKTENRMKANYRNKLIEYSLIRTENCQTICKTNI